MTAAGFGGGASRHDASVWSHVGGSVTSQGRQKYVVLALLPFIGTFSLLGGGAGGWGGGARVAFDKARQFGEPL